MFNKLSLVAKLLLGIALVTVAALGLGIWAITARTQQTTEALAYQGGEQIAHRYAAVVERKLNEAMDLSRTVAVALSSFRQSGRVDRDQVNALLKTLLDSNPQYLGI